VSDKEEPRLRVVDRRWWAQRESAEAETPEQPAATNLKPTYVEELERQLAERSAEIQSYAIEHRRALEEFEQARLRIRRDVAKEVERGRRAVLSEMLEVLDNLDRAIAAAGDQSGSPLHRGIELVRDQFLAALERLGVKKVHALGETFDATRHDAVSTAPVNDAAKDGVVIAVVKEGYAIGEDLLRPAAVVVGSKA
jgi:molecular chaperone GrpE